MNEKNKNAISRKITKAGGGMFEQDIIETKFNVQEMDDNETQVFKEKLKSLGTSEQIKNRPVAKVA